MAKVYFSEKINKDTIQKVTEPLIGNIKPQDKVIIKVHFGEKGNTRFVSAENVKIIADLVKTKTKNIIIADSNTLYKGSRSIARNHLKIAEEHGFSKIGVPIVIGDGEKGTDEYSVPIHTKHFKEAYIGKEYKDYNVIIAISHFKGHVLEGYGGAIKNIGMGMGSRKGKLAMHSKIKPSINSSKCISCRACVANCNEKAIKMPKKAEIDNDLCIGCAQCINICEKHAINIPWGGATSSEVQERTAEYALAATKEKKLVAINFINNITSHCDCMPDTEIIGKDVGITSSIDIVAIDHASFELVVEKHKKDIFKEASGNYGDYITEYGEKIGLGKRVYEIIKI